MSGGEAANPFPSTPQMRVRVPRPVWDAIRALAMLAGAGLVITLFLAPGRGLTIFWGWFIPIVPLVFFVVPGLWRNVCPLATSNQLPRRLGITRALTAPRWLQEYGFVIAIALFLGLVPARKVLLNTNGPALALLLAGVGVAAFAGGVLLKGKSGWCSALCPLLPVQRVYGQTPFAVIRNSHCEPCIGCTTNCYDFNPRLAQLADLSSEDPYRGGYRKVFAGAFPALVLAFYTTSPGHGWGIASMYGRFGLFILGGIGSFFLLDALLKVSSATLAVVYGAAALNLYYWWNVPGLARRALGDAPGWWTWPGRAAVLVLTILWVFRSWSKERQLAATATGSPNVGVGKSATAVLDREAAAGPEVTWLPGERRVAATPGVTLLEAAERSGLPLESGCRMGVCGADPVWIVAGAENLSELGRDERGTLERLGLADSARMACCARVSGPVSVSLAPERREPAAAGAAAALDADSSVRRVVVVGNGIAGVTAAEHVRRRLPDCEIDLVARERHHLYNRMAITKLLYGRAAMKGLYLMPEEWYDEQRITCWLNTRASRIDRKRNVLVLGTGEELPYDRLILTAGSASFLPRFEGSDLSGCFVLREAEDAFTIRSYVQEHGAKQAAVIGGGLLGLEAAYGLHKLGVSVVVIARGRLLDRQLDERGALYLRRYLEGLGIEIVSPNEVAGVEGEGRVQRVRLASGADLPADLVLVCAGISSNAELARAADLAVARGVLVDERMRTSDASIFAAGDAAEFGGQVAGLWPTAVEQGRIAAVNATGGHERFAPVVPETMLKVSGADLTSVGRFEPADGEIEIISEDEVEGRYRKLVVSNGRVVGAILLGAREDTASVAAAVKASVDVEPVLDQLRAGDWSVLAGIES